MKKILVLALMLCLSGCLERIGQIDRNIKPYGARWVKDGITRDSRKMDWVACGGEDDLKEHYERKSGITNKEFFDGLDAYRNQLRACMKGKGYAYRNPSMPGIVDECNAGDCLYP